MGFQVHYVGSDGMKSEDLLLKASKGEEIGKAKLWNMVEISLYRKTHHIQFPSK